MDRESGVALWCQIEERLKRDITAGRWKAGERLPAEPDLAGEFGVNRHTLRRAVAALRDGGLLRVERGRGTFVREDVIDYVVSRRTRFSENIARLDRRPGGRVIRTGIIAATGEVAEALELGRGARVVLIEAVNLVDDRPVSVVSHHFPAPRFRGIDEAFRRTGSVTASLERFGVEDYVRRVSRVSARLPDADDARQLDMPRTWPILFAESVNVDTNGIPVEYSTARSAGHRMHLVFEF